MAATLAGLAQQPEAPSCQSTIVSSTVVATFCGHVADNGQMMDLLILWRGRPGWFQRREGGRSGGGGSRQLGAGTNGHVSQSSFYGNVTISFDADFDTHIVTVGEVSVPLKGVNTLLVDQVDDVNTRRVSATRWNEPRLPSSGDVNLILVRRSRELLAYLQCQIAMPAPSMKASIPQPPVMTVCEKLNSR